MITHTYTVARLPVSKKTFNEIKKVLVAADNKHRLSMSVTGKNRIQETIDMNGLCLCVKSKNDKDY
jgi:hypothetical protein